MSDQVEGHLPVSGNLTVNTVASLVDLVAQATGKTELVIDLQQVEAVDSSAVSLMLLWLREAQRNKVILSFVNVPENLLSLARLYDVAELLPLCRDHAASV